MYLCVWRKLRVMKLDHWLTREGIKPSEFAADPEINASPSTISRIIAGTIWPSRDLAERILKRTSGEVTPNDYLGIEPDPVAAPEAA